MVSRSGGIVKSVLITRQVKSCCILKVGGKENELNQNSVSGRWFYDFPLIGCTYFKHKQLKIL